jgi:hypothetical protein
MFILNKDLLGIDAFSTETVAMHLNYRKKSEKIGEEYSYELQYRCNPSPIS